MNGFELLRPQYHTRNLFLHVNILVVPVGVISNRGSFCALQYDGSDGECRVNEIRDMETVYYHVNQIVSWPSIHEEFHAGAEHYEGVQSFYG